MSSHGVSIQDVAREAQVATSTVSRCLSGRRHVTPATRDRILDACRKLNYQLNPNIQDLARHGRNGHTRNLAFVLGGRPFSQPQYAEIIDPLFEATNRRQYHMTLIRVHGDEDCAFSLPATLRDRRVDGVLLTGVLHRPLLDVLEKRELPFVVMGNYDESLIRGAANVRMNWDRVFRELIALMKAHGVRRPGFLLPNATSYTNREFLARFRRHAAEGGLPVDPERLYIGHDDGEEVVGRMDEVFRRATLPFDGLVCLIAMLAYQMERLWTMRKGFSEQPDLPIYSARHATLLPYQLASNVHLVGNGFDGMPETALDLLIGLIQGERQRCAIMV